MAELTAADRAAMLNISARLTGLTDAERSVLVSRLAGALLGAANSTEQRRQEPQHEIQAALLDALNQTDEDRAATPVRFPTERPWRNR
ncbi:MAG: hypothetical protein ACT4QF_20640 [Sporichthyaceae bacterium]